MAGCDDDAPKLEVIDVAPVAGVLTHQGEPLQQHEVIFYPDDGRRAAVGLTDEEGRFSLGTNKPGDGAPPGMHKVSVKFLPVTPDDLAHLPPGESAGYLRKPTIKISSKFSNPKTSGLTQEVPAEGLHDLKLDLR
jgi:hypothetical protein